MDIHCKFCGEPVNTDEFHDQDTGSWQTWISAFKAFGCGAVDAMFDGKLPKESVKCTSEPVVDEENLMGIEVLQNMLGDDIDGLAAMSEDMFGL